MRKPQIRSKCKRGEGREVLGLSVVKGTLFEEVTFKLRLYDKREPVFR